MFWPLVVHGASSLKFPGGRAVNAGDMTSNTLGIGCGCGIVATCAVGLLAPSICHAEPLRVRATLGAAHALSEPQSDEFGWGGLGGLAVEYKLLPALGLQVGMEGLALADGEPAPEQFESQGSARAFGANGVARLYLPSFGSSDDQAWVAGGAGYVLSGGFDRVGAKADVGYDIRSGDWSFGPFLGYRHVVEPNDSLRPEDARIGTFGIQGMWDPPISSDRDWDRDGIPNDRDRCPRRAEDFDGFEDGDGCPDEDNDGDGVPDVSDQCPDEPEDLDGHEDLDGCPDPDNDGDGLEDGSDSCPNEAEDKDGFQDGDGCPDEDNDGDDILDVRDRCPDEPETVNGYADEDGCPDEVSVRVVGASIRLDERILFDYDKATIRPESGGLVQRVATLLRRHPEYLSISIEGHTDLPGNPEYNQELSLERAQAVRGALVDFGVKASRLSTVGHGNTKPLIQSDEPKQVNRRVEFIIRRKRTVDGRTTTPPQDSRKTAPPASTETDQ